MNAFAAARIQYEEQVAARWKNSFDAPAASGLLSGTPMWNGISLGRLTKVQPAVTLAATALLLCVPLSLPAQHHRKHETHMQIEDAGTPVAAGHAVQRSCDDGQAALRGLPGHYRQRRVADQDAAAGQDEEPHLRDLQDGCVGHEDQAGGGDCDCDLAGAGGGRGRRAAGERELPVYTGVSASAERGVAGDEL